MNNGKKKLFFCFFPSPSNVLFEKKTTKLIALLIAWIMGKKIIFTFLSFSLSFLWNVRGWGVYRRLGGVGSLGCLQPGEVGVPGGRGGFQAYNGKEGFPMPPSNVVARSWEDWKRRRQGGFPTCNGCRRELTGCCGPRRISDGWSGSYCGGGGRV